MLTKHFRVIYTSLCLAGTVFCGSYFRAPDRCFSRTKIAAQNYVFVKWVDNILLCPYFCSVNIKCKAYSILMTKHPYHKNRHMCLGFRRPGKRDWMFIQRRKGIVPFYPHNPDDYRSWMMVSWQVVLFSERQSEKTPKLFPSLVLSNSSRPYIFRIYI
jgi:hypothetical protein